MAYPLPLKKILPGETEASGCLPGRQDNLLDDLRRLLRNSFIRIEYEDPRMTASIDGKLFLRTESLPRFLEHVGSEFPCDLDGIVCAAGINDDDLIGE
jgi:hypothetical protein